MLVIGSTAAKVWMPTFRDPKDLDVWMLPNEFASWYDTNLSRITSFRPQRNINKFFAKIDNITMEIRILTPDCPQLQMVQAQRHEQELGIAGGVFQVASPNTLLALKRSHLEFPLHWEKHIVDYSDLKTYCWDNSDECDWQQDNDLLDAAYNQLYKDTRAKLGIKTANLNMSNEQFFNKSEAIVRRAYDHDSIHRAVMFGNHPMFERIKDDLSKAACSKRLWDELEYQDKVHAVQEEAMVIALERKILPNLLTAQPYDAPLAFAWAVKRICTTLTSGWFRSFAIENWRDCMDLGFDYVAKLDPKRLVINE